MATSSREFPAYPRRGLECTAFAGQGDSGATFKVCAYALQTGNTINHVASQVEAVKLVQDGHIEGRGCRPLLFIAMYMEIVMVMPPVGEPVDQRRIAVVSENDRSIQGEHRIEVCVGKAVRVFGRWLDGHQVNDIDYTNLDIGEMPAKQIDGCKSLQSGNVSGTSHHYIGFGLRIRAGPIPDTYAIRAMLNGSLHIEPLQRRLLTGHDDVHVVAAAQGVIGHREQGVGIGW